MCRFVSSGEMKLGYTLVRDGTAILDNNVLRRRHRPSTVWPRAREGVPAQAFSVYALCVVSSLALYTWSMSYPHDYKLENIELSSISEQPR